MTCIVGLVDDDHVYLGGDAAAVGGWSLHLRADPKVFHLPVPGSVEDVAFGFTSSFRMGDLLRWHLRVPSWSLSGDARYVHVDLLDAIRACLRQGGYAKVENGVETGGLFLLGFRSRLYVVGSDFQVGEPLSGYEAVGSGDDVARGALHATQHVDYQDPVDRVRHALEAAEAHNVGVRGPFSVVVV